jgi:hypothetical protein
VKTFPSLARNVTRSLGKHIDRLRDAFDELHERLHEAVARAVGQSVAGAVHEAVHAALAEVAHRPSSPASYQDTPYYRQSHGLFGQDEPDDGRYDVEPDAWYDEGPEEDDPPEPTRTTRWRRALALGCNSMAWYLRRQATRCSALATVGVGLLSAAAAYVFGPGQMTAALSLFGLAQTLQAGALSLAGLG